MAREQLRLVTNDGNEQRRRVGTEQGPLRTTGQVMKNVHGTTLFANDERRVRTKLQTIQNIEQFPVRWKKRKTQRADV